MAIDGSTTIRQHRDDVVMPVLQVLEVFDVEGLSVGEGEQARIELSEFLDDLDAQASASRTSADRLKARLAARR